MCAHMYIHILVAGSEGISFPCRRGQAAVLTNYANRRARVRCLSPAVQRAVIVKGTKQMCRRCTQSRLPVRGPAIRVLVRVHPRTGPYLNIKMGNKTKRNSLYAYYYRYT